MKRRTFLQQMGQGALATLLVSPRTVFGVAPGKMPNIVFIMADDLGYGDLGCYGQEQILTPNIDRLATEGTRFTQCYSGSTVCAPSRCCLMTGLHNGHGRVRDNIPHYVYLQPDDLTVAEVLKQAGYATGGVGKWSLGDPGYWGIPLYQGFDEWFGHLNQDQAHFYYPDHLWDNDKIRLFPGNRGGKTGEYTHDLFTERALEFISKNKDNPFFLYLAYTIPHWSDYDKKTPMSYPVPSDEPYSDRDWSQTEKNFAAMITRMDRDVGRIVQQLRDLGLEENTIIFFTSDNGPDKTESHDPAFFKSAGPFRGIKRDLYEGGIRIPMVVRWPGKVPAGRVSEQVWAFWDVMPTLAELAGLPIPKKIDGISMLPTILGKKQEQEHKYLYWDYGHVRDTYLQAIRAGDWKGVRIGQNAPVELYNLKDDPAEKDNIAAQHPDVVKTIDEMMKEAYVPSGDYRIGSTYTRTF
ncbi:MAG TPA: arylsulfatase [bacterium]|nr:arylsulfatase [bacterium]HQO33797.1 arylsulfatase [bacterium]HQP97639.1 arylsulfatase [bacterium]